MAGKIPIFFDFGGTLVNTLDVTKSIFKEAFGKEFNDEQIKKMFKDASRKSMGISIFFKYPVNPIKLALSKKKIASLQKEYYMEKIKLHPGAKETIEKLKSNRRLQLILITQNPLMIEKEFSEELLQKLFDSQNPFELILSGEDKLELINSNFSDEEISRGLIIGDLPNDVLLGEILKIPCYGVTWGYSEDFELDTPFIVQEFSDLYEMIIDHIEDLEEDKLKEEQIEEIPFEEIVIEEDYDLIDE